MQNTNTTEETTTTDEVEDKDSKVKAVLHGTGHVLKVVGVSIIDTDLRDIGHGTAKATKATGRGFSRVFKGVNKEARAERKVAKAKQVIAEANTAKRNAKKATK